MDHYFALRMGFTVIRYIEPPRERAPRPKYTAKDILGLYGQPPIYKGGLKAYAGDHKAHRAYKIWKATQ